LPIRRVDLATGEVEIKDLPCGSTRAAVCPSCAARARKLRAQQCREGWHLTEEPDLTPDPPSRRHRELVKDRAEITAAIEDAEAHGDHLTAEACTESLEAADDELAAAGLRGRIEPETKARRARSTRRRKDVPDLPRRAAVNTTLGRVYTDDKRGKTFRPSLFVTTALDSYGPVRREDHTPVNPATYNYLRAARDALHFAKLVDRWTQNLRRVAGYQVQYFAVVEPQKRGAPHAHFAIRGTLPRALVKQLTAATYVSVWWPPAEVPIYSETHYPEWDNGTYVDPDTRVPLPTWEEALDALDADPEAEPYHVVRFGAQVDVKGVLAGSVEAEHCIGYLVKYLVKDLGDDLTPTGRDDFGDEGGRSTAVDTPAVVDAKASAARRADHISRLVEALRWEPCSPQCANWLRYGIQPKKARPNLRPGCCRAKAHKPTHLGYGGRRVLVSRKWTGKDLADHRYDRRAHVLAVLGREHDGTPADNSATAAEVDGQPHGPVIWELAKQTDPDVDPLSRRLLRSIAHVTRWRAEYRTARDGPPVGQADPTASDPPPPTAA
jgi:transcription elongation GreA/GreB family factor